MSDFRDTITDMDRAHALMMVLGDSERQLHLSIGPDVGLDERIDMILRRALAGGLDERRYAALWLVRKIALRIEIPGRRYLYNFGLVGPALAVRLSFAG
jgi:hypothetical protein